MGSRCGPTPGDGAVKTVELASEGLEYDINVVRKAAAGFERIAADFGGSTAPSDSVACYGEIARESKSQLSW